MSNLGHTCVDTEDDEIVVIVESSVEIPQEHRAEAVLIGDTREALQANLTVSLVLVHHVAVALRLKHHLRRLQLERDGLHLVVDRIARLVGLHEHGAVALDIFRELETVGLKSFHLIQSVIEDVLRQLDGHIG